MGRPSIPHLTLTLSAPRGGEGIGPRLYECVNPVGLDPATIANAPLSPNPTDLALCPEDETTLQPERL